MVLFIILFILILVQSILIYDAPKLGSNNLDFYIPKWIKNPEKINSELIYENDYNFEKSNSAHRTLLRKVFNFIGNTKKLTITESNAGLGGITFMLMFYFKKLNIVELDTNRVDILNKNINIYKNYTNIPAQINVINKNYLKIYNSLKQDVILSDFPWFGKDYKKIKNMRLYLELNNNRVYIEDIITELFLKKLVNYYIVFIPFNFDISTFSNIMKTHGINYKLFSYKIKEQYIVCYL